MRDVQPLRTGGPSVDPTTRLEDVVVSVVDLDSPLLAAAGPVLDELDERLLDTPYCTILVDRTGSIVRRWSGTREVNSLLDSLHVVLGLSMREQHVGVNGAGTPIELGRASAVTGAEHTLEAFQTLACYGHPIRHPLTRRIEGVLDITTVVGAANPALPLLISRAAMEIEERLLDGSRASEKRLLAAFQTASALHRRPVLAIGEDLVLSNEAALDLLGPSDVGRLRLLVADGVVGAGLPVELDSGRRVTVEVTAVPGTRRGALLRVRPEDPPASRSSRPLGSRRSPLLVSGPPGSGRSSRAREQTSRGPVVVVPATLAVAEGASAWVRCFEGALRQSLGTVVVDDVDLLDDRLLELVARALTTEDARPIVLTSGPVDQLTGRAAAVVAGATRRETLLPLSARRAELTAIATRMLSKIDPATRLELAPGAAVALTAQAWPGNLRELDAVLRHAVEHRWGTTINVDDLPEAYRSAVPERPLAPLDKAQRDVIVATLRRLGGNKVAAARELGLSRTTLYARMRTLRITAY